MISCNNCGLGHKTFEESSAETLNHHESNWETSARIRELTENNIQLRKQLAKTSSLLLRYLANDDRADALTHKTQEWLISLGWDL